MSDLIERVKKILALAADNPSAEEAAVAAAKAQALIEEHAIDVALLSAQEAPEEAKLQEIGERRVYAFSGSRVVHWVLDLAHGVCAAAGLFSWSGWGGPPSKSFRVVKASGPLEALVAAEILTDWLVREVESLARRAKKGEDWEPGRSYANSFRMGCAAEISRRLKSAAEESRVEAKRRASMTREEAYALAMEEGDAETLVSLDSGSKRYALSVVSSAFELVAKQKEGNKSWAKARHEFTSGGYSGTSYGGGWSSGVAAGKRAKISAPGRIA